MAKYLSKITFPVAAIFLFLATPALASQFGESLNKTIANVGANQQTDLTLVAAQIVQALLGILGLVFLLLLIYAGTRWMLSQGEPKKIESAKNIIKAAVIGLLIVFFAYSIAYFVTYLLSRAALNQ